MRTVVFLIGLAPLLAGADDHVANADAAAAKARSETGGRVVDVQRKVVDGKPSYKVKVVTEDGRVRVLGYPGGE
ncbi:MAG: peptidase [Pseudomonadota bacterium]